MRTRPILSATVLALGLVTVGSLYLVGQQKEDKQPNGAAINPPWTAAEVIKAEDLNRMLPNKPHVFHVGFEVLYKSKHIPGSIYAGPGNKDSGLEQLKLAVAKVPRDSEIVLYCGCCPWDHCPNMKPAYKVLHDMGFKKIKITEIPTNFAKDWIDKGFPVEGATAGSSSGQ